MNRKQIIHGIRKLEITHCEKCKTRLEIVKTQSDKKAHRYCIEQCEIGEAIQQYGKLLGCQFEEVHKRWSSDEVNYLMNHYKVLGPTKLALKLNRTVHAVSSRYKKEKARQTAI